MKLCALALLATASVSLAIDARDSSPIASTITTTIANVQASIDNLTNAAKAFDGHNIDPIVDASNSLIQTITSGILTSEDPKLTTFQALALQTPVADLKSHAQGLLDTFKAGLDQIEMAKACGKTRLQLGKISDSGGKLIDSIVGKIPGFAQKIAEGQTAPIKKMLIDAANIFSEGNCVDS
ncbi:hypothetical protein NQ176_g1952 [Zarea fungicola]|uniref:Uncharacterized protein n=1 Tax=Zarea fungicola TaxID=93591 RepID=A0ACC1NQG5_9HYPO|nr:hypothetical protein NQ176_g1952 [Lecanicillium fungicola]